MDAVMLEVKEVAKRFALSHHKRKNLKEFLGELLHGRRGNSSRFTALENISFTVKEGEALGIIGRNGAGKSTLLKILSGILQPDEGEINFYGRTVSILDIGAGFHPELTGRENVFFAASLYGFSKKEVESQLDEIVAFSAIGQFIDEPVKNYSSGMYLRLAFAIITFLEADIYLIDEVISVGDADFQVKCKAKMDELIKRGKTLIIVSHNLNEISVICSRILLLEKGHIVKQGKFEVIQQYLAASLSQFDKISGNDFYQLKDITGPLEKAPEMVITASGIKHFVQIANGISNQHPITVFIRFALHRDKRIAFVLRFFDQTNMLLFIATTFQHTTQDIHQRGDYTAEFEIPAFLLNNGLYTVGLSVFENTLPAQAGPEDKMASPVLLYREDKILSLKIADEDTDNLPFTYPGMIKPTVPVRISYLDAEAKPA